MYNLFSYLIIFGFIFLAIGLFNPNFSLFWYKQKRTKKNSAIIYILVIIVSFFMLGVFSPADDSVIDSSESLKVESKIEKFNCKILDTETTNTNKMTIYIQIPEQLNKTQLREIAYELKEKNSKYENLYIFYLLPNMKIGAGAWATSHYNPNLDIKIIGIDKTIEDKLKNIKLPKGEIIGKWLDSSPYMENSIIIYKTNGVYKMTRNYKDDSKSEKNLQSSKISGKLRFEYKNKFGEYFLIENDGSLGLYDENGLITTAKEIE